MKLYFIVNVDSEISHQLLGHLGVECGASIFQWFCQTSSTLSLYHSATNLSENDLRNYLLMWRLDLEDELLNDPHGALGRTYPSLANTIPLTFPDPKVLRQYTHPLTSSINLVGSSTRMSKWFNLAFPNTVALALLCDQYFGWGPDILNCLRLVWDGYFIQQLVQASRSLPVELPGGKNLGSNSIRHITLVGTKISSRSAFPSYRVEFF
jgi:hypothetical protein